MSTELIINASLPETRIALMEDGEIQEILIERASEKGIVGNIYKGRVTRVLPGMQAAFVDIGLEKAAFLYVDDVYSHASLWEDDGSRRGRSNENREDPSRESSSEGGQAASEAEAEAGASPERPEHDEERDADPIEDEVFGTVHGGEDDDEDSDDGEGEESGDPVSMGPGGDGDQPEGTVSAAGGGSGDGDDGDDGDDDGDDGDDGDEGGAESESALGDDIPGEGHMQLRRRPPRRGRRGGRRRRRGRDRDGQSAQGQGQGPAQGPAQGGGRGQGPRPQAQPVDSAPTGDSSDAGSERLPSHLHHQFNDRGNLQSDRAAVAMGQGVEGGEQHPAAQTEGEGAAQNGPATLGRNQVREELRAQRGRDRRIRSKSSNRPPRAQVNIQDLLKEGQEVLVQVAKDPIATKGARLTCHISLPGRHLVCMPTIDHVGVSRRIERDDERRRLREYVEQHRPNGLGFIVRTASGKQSERRISQDMEYLDRTWSEIKEKAAQVQAPAMVYEDLNSVLRSIRDWVNEDVNKVIVDSRYHYNEILKFVGHFMPQIKNKVELYHGDIPVFDAYGISAELSRALERKVWLKSGGYIVIDQAEALVAIDVNTGRFVGKKNLEDTILKTNLEAVQEISYQLRLRNCGGIIILDLIDMEKEENKQRVYRALEEALRKDRARPSILKISELGLVEMTRKRTRDTMVRTLCEPCNHCEGKGFVKNRMTVAYEVMREIEREGIEREMTKILVQAHPEVIDVLAIEHRDVIDQLERRYRKQVFLQAVMDFHPEQFEVAGDKRDKATLPSIAARERARESRERHRGNRDRNRDRDRGGHHRRDGGGGGHQGRPNRGGEGIVTGVVPVVPGADAMPMPADMSEEDRLAYLRAQATQDAAMAQGGAPGAPQSGGQGGGQGYGNGGGNGRSRRGGRGGRGGRGRRGRGNFSGGRDAGAGPGAGAQAGAPSSAPIVPPPVGPSGSGSDGGGQTPAT